jgi:hypothetical protein
VYAIFDNAVFVDCAYSRLFTRREMTNQLSQNISPVNNNSDGK